MRKFLMLLLASTLGFSAPVYADKAPEFTLRDINGQQITLSQYEGKVVLLSFWATWCAPCQAEMPHLQRFQDTYAEKGLQVISINTDDARSSASVKPIVKSKGLSIPVLLDKDTTVVGLYNPAKTLPYSVLIDKNGEINKVFTGYEPGDEVEVEEAFKVLLAPAE